MSSSPRNGKRKKGVQIPAVVIPIVIAIVLTFVPDSMTEFPQRPIGGDHVAWAEYYANMASVTSFKIVEFFSYIVSFL